MSSAVPAAPRSESNLGAGAGVPSRQEPDVQDASPALGTPPDGDSEAVPVWPPVSVILPILNEERHLADAVRRILEQGYPGELEVVLALGPSTDRTDEVAAALVRDDARVHTVTNPSGRTPSALNAAIAAAKHQILVRVDGHGLLGREYITTAVRLLSDTGAVNVGGVMAAEGVTDFGKAVAAAMTSVFGVGGARFHTGGEAGPAETVYLGVFRREAVEAMGGYDESYLRAQDWELNHRLRSAGHLVYFSPKLSVTYRPRSTLKALAKQYYNYGRWRRVVMRQHTGTVSARYLAAPVTVLACTAGVLGAVITPWTLIVPAGYVAGVVGATAIIARGDRDLPAGAVVRLPVVLATMHFSWGIGFLTSPKALAETTRRPAPEPS